MLHKYNLGVDGSTRTRKSWECLTLPGNWDYLGGTGESQGEDTAHELPQLLRMLILLTRHQKLLKGCMRPKTGQEKQHTAKKTNSL